MRFDVTIESHAYVLGFLQGDGHMQKPKARGEHDQRGAIQVEIGVKDIEIIHALRAILGEYASTISHRTRDLPSNPGFSSVRLLFRSLDLRNQLEAAGLPYGDKATTIREPNTDYHRQGYWRGLIDADGSVGFSSPPRRRPFVSLATSSDYIARGFEKYILQVTGAVRTNNRNKRGHYNLMVWAEGAQKICQDLYQDASVFLPRKQLKAIEALSWSRR